MYATKDSQLRGLQRRRRYERGAFEAAITGKDLTGTNAYQQYDPLISNYQSSNSPATKRRNIQWTDTINLNDGSLIQPNQQAPSLMQQLAHSEDYAREFQAEVARLKQKLNNTSLFSKQPKKNQQYIIQELSDTFDILPSEVKDILTKMDGKFERGGKLIKNNK